MLPRVLEPEVMDTAAEAEDYNAMDHSAVNRVFVDDLLAVMASLAAPIDRPWNIFDAGTGTALIPLQLAGRIESVHITAADLAEEMLIVARRNIVASGWEGSIQLIRSDCKALSDDDASYDVVMSNSIVHHIPEPASVLRECWRLVRPGGLLFFRDLLRPENETQLDYLVVTYAGSANAHGQQMFRDSLHAALTLDEVAALAREIGITDFSLRHTSDRHWTLTAIR